MVTKPGDKFKCYVLNKRIQENIRAHAQKKNQKSNIIKSLQVLVDTFT